MALTFYRVGQRQLAFINSGNKEVQMFRLGEDADAIKEDYPSFISARKAEIADWPQDSASFRELEFTAKNLGVELVFPLKWPESLFNQEFAYPNAFTPLLDQSGSAYSVCNPATAAALNHAKGIVAEWQHDPLNYYWVTNFITIQSLNGFNDLIQPGGWETSLNNQLELLNKIFSVCETFDTNSVFMVMSSLYVKLLLQTHFKVDHVDDIRSFVFA